MADYTQNSIHAYNTTCNTSWELTDGWKDGNKIVKTIPMEIVFNIENIYSAEGITSANLVFTEQGGGTGEIDISGFLVSHENGAYEDIHFLLDGTMQRYSWLVVGEWDVQVVFELNVPQSEPIAISYGIGLVTITESKWRTTIHVNSSPPIIHGGNIAVIDELSIYNYWDEDYETHTDVPVKVIQRNNNSWSFEYDFSLSQIDQYSENTGVAKCSFSYTSSVTHEKEYRNAFFSTSRNQNYSNGIYNLVFVSGVVDHPNYSSRVWWSEVNNPLYFPDTNYSEVGSNDTSIMGLTKVGDYLCAVKQSKTTDTAIYLLYPTSFEDDTTFAIKQGVQGVGALAKYSFNILNDETLFLSPNGVMAIIPTEDDDHKTQNRSYFVDGRLLKEENIKDAFSFVHDGMYYLAVPSDKRRVYVLDGNQRNSWGNDRTNLVYECYYLENVPAKTFAKFNDELVFEDGENLCVFNNGYTDAYSKDGLNVPVSAEWSTLLDDDGSLHYYKTMQKKGNLISILPIENQRPYMEVEVTEEEYDEYKALLFVKVGKKYVKCTGDYDANETYYVENRSATKVYVKRDDKEEVEIKRVFGLQSDIPSEMYLKKKFKKYKRLQFIIRNNAAEDFGIDEIVKSYTVGNYAKK